MKKTIKQWVLDTQELQQIREIAEHGCVSGICSELIYYTDTVAFHDLHENEIWDNLWEDAVNQDMTPMRLIASLNGQILVGSMHQLKNLLTWYAVESVCFELVDILDRDSTQDDYNDYVQSQIDAHLTPSDFDTWVIHELQNINEDTE